MDEVLFNRYGKSVYRLCGAAFYDFYGKPRGFLVGKTVYDVRGQHRGFYVNQVVIDRMGRILGFAEGAQANGFKFPLVEIPPVPYKNLPAPEVPSDAADRRNPAIVPAWSMMQLGNLLV
jgi:hypothetical protein